MTIRWKKEWTAPALVGVVSFAAGVGAGYIVAYKKLGQEFDEALDAAGILGDGLDKMVEDAVVVPDSTDLTYVTDNSAAVQEVFEKFRDAVVPYSGTDDQQVVEHVRVPEDASVNNVFEDDWDIAEELPNRGPDHPYVIHLNEFVQQESGYNQQTLEWYEGDRILCEQNNVIVPNPEKVVGRLEFGRGSNDPYVVYIRNDRLRAEYEVVRNEGSYQIEVLGLEADQAAADDELKHSATIRRFRDRD